MCLLHFDNLIFKAQNFKCFKEMVIYNKIYKRDVALVRDRAFS